MVYLDQILHIYYKIDKEKKKKWARLRLDPSHCAPGFLLQQSVLDHSATTYDKHFIHPLPVLVRLKLHDPWVCALCTIWYVPWFSRQTKIARPLGLHYIARPLGLHYNHYVSRMTIVYVLYCTTHGYALKSLSESCTIIRSVL